MRLKRWVGGMTVFAQTQRMRSAYQDGLYYLVGGELDLRDLFTREIEESLGKIVLKLSCIIFFAAVDLRIHHQNP